MIDISSELKDFENDNQNFFYNDLNKTLDFFETAIQKLLEIKERILRYENEENKINQERYSSSEKMMNEESVSEMSAMLRPSFMSYESFEDFEQTDKILSFEDIEHNIFKKLFVPINHEIYINFLAIKELRNIIII